MMAQRVDIRANMDRPLVIMYLLFMIMGWANIYSAAYDPEHANLFDRRMARSMSVATCVGWPSCWAPAS